MPTAPVPPPAPTVVRRIRVQDPIGLESAQNGKTGVVVGHPDPQLTTARLDGETRLRNFPTNRLKPEVK